VKSVRPLRFSRRGFRLASAPGLLIAAALVFLSCGTLPRRPETDHWDGSVFRNPNSGSDHSWGDMVKWIWEMDTVDWPDWIVDESLPKPEPSVAPRRIKATYVNHATVLIQAAGINVLTDPVWSYRVGPLSWLGSKRIRAPGVAFEDLPPIDLVLVSHDHYDHLDLPTLKTLRARGNPLVVTGLGVGALVREAGFDRVVELDWWETVRMEGRGFEIVFVPALHNSGRGPFSKNGSLWGGFVLRWSGGSVYFAGDTGFGEFLSELGERYLGPDLAILPVGNYEKRWFMKNQHMSPDDAVKALLLLRAGQGMGMHFATFLEHPEQAVDAHEKDLAEALKARGVSADRFWLLKFGEGRYVEAK